MEYRKGKDNIDDHDLTVFRFSPKNVFVYDPSIQVKSIPHDFFDVCEARMRGFDPNYIRDFPVITNSDERNLAIRLYRMWRENSDIEKIKQEGKKLVKEIAEKQRMLFGIAPNDKARKLARNINLSKSGPITDKNIFTDNKNLDIAEICSKYGISSFYHITNIQNLSGIIRHGLLCRNKAKFLKDISDSEIQDHRHYKRNPHFPQLTLHDCVPLFFAPKSPMLSARRDQQAEIVYLLIDPMVLSLPEVTFTDGNARSNSTKFFKNLDDLKKLDWRILSADYWNDEDPDVHLENKRRRSAEVLVAGCVQPTYIQKIGVMNDNALQMARTIVEKAGMNIPVQIDLGKYFVSGAGFQVFTYEDGLSEYDFSVEENAPEPPPNFEGNEPY